MSFQILSDVSKQYLLEEDAIKGFRMAVENGQSRLALTILADIIDVFNGIFVEMLSDDEDNKAETKPVDEVKTEVKTEVKAEVKAEAKAEEKELQQKVAPKKETKTAEEK